VQVGYRKSSGDFVFSLQNSGDPIGIQLQLRQNGRVYSLPEHFQLASTRSPVEIIFHYSTHQFSLGDRKISTANSEAKFSKNMVEPLHFVKPALNPNLKTLTGPDYPTIDAMHATAHSDSARILVDVKDPEGDDLGPREAYSYPTDPHFQPGIFDLTGFKVTYDDTNLYFDIRLNNLVQPGWHPEYGFQLTYVGIGIHTGEKSGTRSFGQNAQYQVDTADPMQFLLYIGGGYRLTDASGHILLGYIPVQTGFPMADLKTKTIHIAVPRRYLPQPKKWWKYTVIAGAQDDHGGAGLGEFRTVKPKTGPWYGGGKTDPIAPNWYDILTVGY